MRRCKHTSGKTRLVGAHNTHWWTGPPVETEDWQDWVVDGRCEYGRCVEWNCPICGCNRYGGYGPVDCPCDDGIGYHDMRRKPKVPIKPSVHRNGAKQQARRRRR